MPKGAIPAGSPTAEDVKPEENADLAASAALESSTSNDVNTAPSAEPSDASSEGAAEKPDASKQAVPSPLDELRNRKVGTDAAAEGHAPEATDEPGEKPAETEAAASDVAVDDVPAKAKDDAGKPAKPEAKPGAADEDPLETLSPEARKHIGREAGARIRELNTKWRDSEKARKGDEPLVRGGRLLQRYLTDREAPLSPQDAISGLEFAKLVKRGDQRSLELLRESVAELEDVLGVQRAPAADEIQPFEGELPASMQGLIDYGAKEEEVRLLHAVRVRKAEQERSAQAGAQRGQPVQRQVPQRQLPAQPQRQLAAPQPVNAYGHSLVAAQAAGDACVAYLESQNIAAGPAMDAYFDSEILPRLAKHAQRGDIESIAPEDRLRLVQIAHQHAIIEKRKKDVAQRDRARPVSGGTSPTPQTRAQSAQAASNPLAALRAKKVGR